MKKPNATKKRIFDIIQIGQTGDRASRLFDWFLAFVIVISILATILLTFASLQPYFTLFKAVEIITTLIFMAEYILRIWTADCLHPETSYRKAILKFIISADGIIMLLTIIPVFFLSGFVVIRMLRVVRIFHLFRINATYDSFNVIKSVLLEKKNQIASSVFILVVLMLASSLCMYGVEHEAQPEAFANAFSGIWWSVSTMFTIGYGDIYPVTTLGRALAVVISFLGVGAVAIPTGIISAGFIENYAELEKYNVFEDTVKYIEIGMDSAWIGLDKYSLEEKYNAALLLAERDGVRYQPDDDYRITIGDKLLINRNSH